VTQIVAFGNCQARGIATLLEMLLPDSFATPTFLSNNARTGRMRPPGEILETLNNANLVIFQPLRRDHGELSEANVRASLDGSTRLIAFSYIFNSGVAGFCYAHNAKSRHSYGKIFGEKAVIERLEQGAHGEQLVDDYLRGELDLHVVERFDECMNRMADREGGNEIRLRDFILDTYRDVRLFLMHNHPTTALYTEILRQLKSLTDLPIDVDALQARAAEEDNVAGHAYAPDSLPISPRDAEELGYRFDPDPKWSEIGPKLIKLIAEEWDGDGSRGQGNGRRLRVNT
jgi:hypothetical protein